MTPLPLAIGLATACLFLVGMTKRPSVLPTQEAAPILALVHGRGQEAKGLEVVRDTFVETFMRSQKRVFGAEVVPRDRVRFIWYADVIDPRVSRQPGAPHCRFAGRESESAAAGLTTLRERLVEIARQLRLDAAALRWFTEDTFKYLSEPAVRCEVDGRLLAVLSDAAASKSRVVVVAHSMGAMVAISSIAQNASHVDSASRANVSRLVTIGAQVGLKEILRGLMGQYAELPVPVPSTVAGWDNFMNDGDALAFPLRAAFKATATERAPVDRRIVAMGERHAASTYLSHDDVVRAVVGAWCSATRTATPACRTR